MLEDFEELLEGGALMHNGRRYLLVEPASIVDLQKSMEGGMGSEAVGQALYLSGHRQGSVMTAQAVEDLSLGQEETIRYMTALGRQMGWGRVEITALGLGSGTLELEVFHSAFAEEYGKADGPVCHLIRGFYAGAWQAVIGSEVEGLETHCRAEEGPRACEFVYAAASGRRSLRVSINQDKPETESD